MKPEVDRGRLYSVGSQPVAPWAKKEFHLKCRRFFLDLFVFVAAMGPGKHFRNPFCYPETILSLSAQISPYTWFSIDRLHLASQNHQIGSLDGLNQS
jgi:hypothetical protein